MAYEHLRISREKLINIRRKRKPNFPKIAVDHVVHSQSLTTDLSNAIRVGENQTRSDNDNLIFKIDYSNYIDTEHLANHGVDFVSQQGKETIVVCADQEGLKVFNDHLQNLDPNDRTITYKDILYKIQKIDNWTSEDRKSWAIRHRGFPTVDTFLLDIELWPVCNNSQDQQRKDFIVVTRQDKSWGKTISNLLENYALVVTLTDRENANANLYTQIKERIKLKNQEYVRV